MQSGLRNKRIMKVRPSTRYKRYRRVGRKQGRGQADRTAGSDATKPCHTCSKPQLRLL